MKIILYFAFILYSASQFGYAQNVDTIFVSGLPFAYQKIDGWKQLSVDSGICIYQGTNIKFEMPFSEPTCGGEISFAISYITDKEREERKSNKPLDIEEDVLSEDTWSPKLNKYTMLGGSFETTSPRVFEIEGETKKEKRNRQKRWEQDPIHNYSSWLYFPINDTLELLLSFSGRIPHSFEQKMDGKLLQFADYFFQSNDSMLDSLLTITDPYRFESKTLPMDSVYLMKTVFKYPVLPNWQYDTTRTSTELKTNFLKVQTIQQSTCNRASISLNVRTTKKDNKPSIDDLRLLSNYALYSHFGYKPPRVDTAQIRQERDSTFKAQEQHYYFTQVSSYEQSSSCTAQEISETVCVIIYPRQDEKIKITLNFECVAEDYNTERDYIHAYYRFIILMIEGNDFEQFYLNNKKD